MAPLDRLHPLPVGVERAAHAFTTNEETRMRVRMTTTRTAAPDGVVAVELAEGTVHDLPAHLARRYVEVGAAVAVIDSDVPPAPAEVAALDGPDEAPAEEPAEAQGAPPAPDNQARRGPGRRK